MSSAPHATGVRLQKVLAAAGVGSRRTCEALIDAGRVSVDGAVVTTQGTRIDPQSAVVTVDGVRINVRADLVYLALNKPRGVVSTMSDERGRQALADLLADRPERLFHVGRLDQDSEGLLLLTNDGELAHRLMHPAFGVPKTYLATVPGPISTSVGPRLRRGVELDDGRASVDSFRVVQSGEDRAMVEVVLHEGRKHIVRRLLAAVGHPVQRLVRTRIGPVRLAGLRPGEYRELTQAELGELFAASGSAQVTILDGVPEPRSFAAVVAMDGPSGTGKSTVSRLLAQRLGARYLDTGAMYRAATLAALRAGVDLADADAVADCVARAEIDVSTDPDHPAATLDGADVAAAIRSEQVTAAVSAVSAVSAVRSRLVDQQRRLIGDGGIVVEGRDIGTVVWPAAETLVYLTASPGVRAERRAGEGASSAEIASVAADIERRDRYDSSRADSPLRRASRATTVDTTGLSIDQVVDRIAALVSESQPR